MIIVKGVFGNINCDVKDIYIDDTFNQLMVTHAWNDYTPESNRDPITEKFNANYKAKRFMGWIFNQMKAQRHAENIIIDLNECPFLQELMRE